MLKIIDLLAIAELYRVAAGLSEEKTVSHRVFGDSKRLTAMRSHNADITVSRFHAALEWFAANWPEGHERPALLAGFVASGLNDARDVA